MSRTNETKHIEWHETCKCKCRVQLQMQVFVTITKDGITINADVSVKH